MRVFLTVLLLAAAGPAAPEAPKPDSPQERPAAPGPRLNLRLDDAARYTRGTAGEERGSADALPSLGANARPLPTSPTPTPETARPFPKDAERGER